jgi:hypothetical protein
MKRVLATGIAVAVGDGTLLGAALALGWTAIAVAAAVVGVVGAVLVALSAPAARTAAPATVTLGLPLRDDKARSETAETEPARQTAPVRDEVPVGAVGTPSPVAA